MGNLCSSCLKGSVEDSVQPDMVTRRRLQEEAAERRRQESERRGIKNPEKVRRQQEKSLELERRELEAAKSLDGGPALKWQTG